MREIIYSAERIDKDTLNKRQMYYLVNSDFVNSTSERLARNFSEISFRTGTIDGYIANGTVILVEHPNERPPIIRAISETPATLKTGVRLFGLLYMETTTQQEQRLHEGGLGTEERETQPWFRALTVPEQANEL